MRTLSRTVVALTIVAGAMTAGAAVKPATAQGVYIQGPGFGVTIGRPAYREPYYRSYRGYRGYDAYAYSGRPYFRGHPRHSHNGVTATGINYPQLVLGSRPYGVATSPSRKQADKKRSSARIARAAPIWTLFCLFLS